MTRTFSYVLALVFFISSIMVWSLPFEDTLRAEEGIESAEERAENVSSQSVAFFSRARKTTIPEVRELIYSSNLNAIQVHTIQSNLDLSHYQNKNTNTPIHIAKQVFLI